MLARRLATATLPRWPSPVFLHSPAAAAWPDAGAPVSAARSPPPQWCTDANLFQAEKVAIWHKAWLPLCRADVVAATSAWCAADAAGAPLLAARDGAGTLRAFHNVCRHQCSTLAPSGACGAGERVVCPYHGWEYTLDGRLAKAPRVGGVAGFRPAEHGLLPAGGADAWGPLAFARVLPSEGPDPAPTVADWLGAAAAASLARPGGAADVEGMLPVACKTFTVPANWKVVAANYLDGCYHCPGAHPRLAAALDLKSYAVELHARCSVQSVAPATVSGARTAGRRAEYAFIYPGLMLNRYGPWLDVNVLTPLAVDVTRITYWWWVEAGALGGADPPPPPPAGVGAGGDSSDPWPPPGLPPRMAADLAASVAVQAEDSALCGAVQAGLASPAAAGGRYAPALEAPAHHFHRLVWSDYQAAGLAG